MAEALALWYCRKVWLSSSIWLVVCAAWHKAFSTFVGAASSAPVSICTLLACMMQHTARYAARHHFA